MSVAGILEALCLEELCLAHTLLGARGSEGGSQDCLLQAFWKHFALKNCAWHTLLGARGSEEGHKIACCRHSGGTLP